MEAVPPAHHCANHPMVPTGVTCARCGRPFCEDCLTEMMGSRVCGWCRDLQLQRLQPAAPASARAVVMWARIFDWVMLVGGVLVTGLVGVFALNALNPPLSVSSPSPGTTTVVTRSSPDGFFLGIMAVVLLLNVVLYLPPAIGLGPGRPWLWTWQMVALVVSVIGGCITIGYLGVLAAGPAVALWIFWVKPEVRAYLEQPDGG
ncbi:MAG TPA: hypothetical protein VK689_13210 [Armatimonadota bacterium]|nr:hypothetical protein [Armatimonadota bacterium]